MICTKVKGSAPRGTMPDDTGHPKRSPAWRTSSRTTLARRTPECAFSPEAIDLLEEAVSNFGAFHFPPFEGLFSAKLAEARLLLGNISGARKAAERSRDLTISCGCRYGTGWAFRALARVARVEGSNVEGDDLLLQAQTIFSEIGASIELQRTTQSLAE